MFVSIMTINHTKNGGQPTPETLCISNMSHVINNSRHNVRVMNKVLSQTSAESQYCLVAVQQLLWRTVLSAPGHVSVSSDNH
jgi:hypothetical protein